MSDYINNHKLMGLTIKTFILMVLFFDIFYILETGYVLTPMTYLVVFIFSHYILYRVHKKLDFIEIRYYELMKLILSSLLCFLMHLDTIYNLPLGLILAVLYLLVQLLMVSNILFRLLSVLPLAMAVLGMSLGQEEYVFMNHLDFLVLMVGVVLMALVFSRLLNEKMGDLYEDLAKAKDQEALYKAMYTNQQDGVLVIRNEMIVSCNASAVAMFAFKQARDLINKSIDCLYPHLQPDGETSRTKVDNVLKDLSVHKRDQLKFYLLRGEESFLADLHLNIISLDNEDFIHAVIRDISSSEEAENALKHKKALEAEKTKVLNDKQTVLLSMMEDIEAARRNSDLLNKSLEKEMEKTKALFTEAEAASKAKSDFLSNMSHELRTPMNGIIGMNRLLIESGLDPEQKQYALEVDQSAKALLTLVQDILDFIDIGADRVILEEDMFELDQVLQETIENSGQPAPGVGLYYYPTRKMDRFYYGDQKKLSHILNHLINNAIKYTHKGNIYLRALSLSEGETKSKVRFEVIDSGIGIPDKLKDSIFDSFTQVESSATRDYGGKGLGLSIAKGLVDIFGGEIGVVSKIDHGSTFWFEIDLGRVNDQARFKVSKLNTKTLLALSQDPCDHWYLNEIANQWHMNLVMLNHIDELLIDLRDVYKKGELALLIDEDYPSSYEDIISRINLENDFNDMPVMVMGWEDKENFIHKPLNQYELYDSLISFKSRISPETHYSLDLNASILLGYDDQIKRQVIAIGLERLGCQVTQVSDCQAFYDQMRDNVFDMVFIGCKQPDPGQLDRIRQMELDQNFPKTPIIAIKDGAWESPAYDHFDDEIVSPVEEGVLVNLLRKWCLETEDDHMDYNEYRLKDLFGEDQEGIQEILGIAMKDIPDLIEAMKTGLVHDDLKYIKSFAHKLKGLCANVGAEVLTEMAKQVEDMTLDQVGNQIEGLEVAFHAFVDAVKNN